METVARDIRWVIVALLFFFSSFGGLWRTAARLKDGIAADRLPAGPARMLLTEVQFVRYASLLLTVGGICAYFYPRAFQSGVWWLAGLWVFLAVALASQGLTLLGRAPKE